jgi:ceramide glucosyltransferase
MGTVPRPVPDAGGGGVNVEAVVRIWVAAYAAAAVIAVARAMQRAGESENENENEAESESVMLLRPVAGEEVGLARRLEATGGARFVVFAVGTRSDPAEPIAQRVAARLRARGVDASVFVTRAVGPNHKADQIARALALPRARTRAIVVVADADVELGDDAVLRLAGALGSNGAVWAPPVERGVTRTWGDRASQAVLDASFHSFPILAGIDPNGLVGKLFAVRRSALDATGGFEALTHHLGEDMELARRLRLAGYRVRVARRPAIATAEGRSLRDILGRYTRWLLVVRAQRASLLLSYPLLLAAAPLFVAVLAFAIHRQDRALATLAVAGLAVRLGIACFARATAGLAIAPLTAAFQSLAADVLLLIALVAACTTRAITWRGRRLAIGQDGTLGDAREHALRELTEPAGTRAHDRRESVSAIASSSGGLRGAGAGVDTRGDRRRDARELAVDASSLRLESDGDVALGSERGAERDPQVGTLGGAEDVPQPDRDDERSPRHTRDLGRARPELEPTERRPLATLGEDPHRAPGGIEELGGVPDGAGAVGGLVGVDAERADAPEEGHTSQVRRIHHRVPVAVEQQLRHVERDERVPPRGVVGDEEQRSTRSGDASLGEPGHEDAPEGPPDAAAGVPRKPGVEPCALGGLDHEVTS